MVPLFFRPLTTARGYVDDEIVGWIARPDDVERQRRQRLMKIDKESITDDRTTIDDARAG
jgi:hypothetical protein